MSVKEYLKNLVKLKTISGRNPDEFKKALGYIDSVMSDISEWSYREYNSRGFVSRVYSHKKYIEEDSKNFDVYLYGNIDVVDGGDSLFNMIETNGRLYGRGTIDMKFGVAVAMDTLKGLSKRVLEKPIALIITTDEELGGIDGAKYLVDELEYRGKCIIGPNGVLDEKFFNLELSNKGTIHTKYFAKGIPSHGSRPWRGENAIEKLIQMYLELKKDFDKGTEKVWDSTINLGILEGGFATNAVADEAKMHIDFRYIDKAQADQYYKKEKKLMRKYKVSKELIVDAMNIKVDLDSEIYKMYRNILSKRVGDNLIQEIKSEGSHDIREFYKVGILPLIFTPRGGDHHTDYEWILEDDLELLVSINLDFIMSFFGF